MARAEETPTDTDDWVINEEADRELGRLIIRYGLLTMVLLVIVPISMAPFNIPTSAFYRDRRFIDTLSALVVMMPFFLGSSRVFAARLRIGRQLVCKEQWKQAVAALEPFSKPTQRFLDTTGEAHELLTVAYGKLGERDLAAKCTAFLARNRRVPGSASVQSVKPRKSTSRSKTSRKKR